MTQLKNMPRVDELNYYERDDKWYVQVFSSTLALSAHDTPESLRDNIAAGLETNAMDFCDGVDPLIVFHDAQHLVRNVCKLAVLSTSIPWTRTPHRRCKIDVDEVTLETESDAKALIQLFEKRANEILVLFNARQTL